VVFGAGPSRLLREGQADAALLHAPPDELGGLDTEALLTEAPVAVLPASHPLAQRASLRMTDLAGENLHTKPADPAAMKSISELMHLIAPHGQAQSPAAACRLSAAGPCHPGTTTRPGMCN
jgi:DNA-binding transcriptional LysR family regulator